MEIIVLVKQVPTTESLIEIADDGVSIKTDNIKWVMNPYDEIAVEEALRIKADQGGTVTVLSVGTDKSAEALRTALAMGADKAVLVNDPEAHECDVASTARIIAGALKDMAFDLIIAGQRAVDDDSFYVGPAVSELLGIPGVSMVVKQEIKDGKITVTRTVEGGTVVLEAPLPALITTQRGLNEPRYASLPGIMKAKKKPIDVKTLADLGLGADSVKKPQVVSMQLPRSRKAGKMIEGESATEKAAALVKALKEEAKVI